MSRQWNQNPDGADSFRSIDDISFRGSLDPEKLVWLQIRSCFIAHNVGDEIAFGNAVMGLLAFIPSSKRREIEAREDEYIIEEDAWVPLRIGGVSLSSDPEYPVLINRKGIDLDYDPDFNGGEPKQISPIKKHIVKWDYYKLFVMIQEALEEAKLSWRMEQVCEELGRIPKKDPPPTPTLAPEISIDKDEEEDEQN